MKDVTIYIDQFEVIKGSVDDYLRSLKLPVSTATNENDIYTNVALLRDERNKLFEFGTKLRKIKRILSPVYEEQKDEEFRVASDFLLVEQNVKGLKTKDERDIVIRARILRHREQKRDFVNLEPVIKDLDAVLLDVNLAIQELQKTFDEYSLIYNFEKLVSTGNLLSMSRHPLDYMSKK